MLEILQQIFKMNIFKTIAAVILCTYFISCNNAHKEISADKEVIDSLKTDVSNIRSIGETLLPEAKKKVEGWEAYQQLDQLITKYYTADASEALNLSKELSTTTKQLKDSLTIERFKENDVMIRINVLYNYTLRLHDMASISKITEKEVNDETQNILDAFSALNSKINNITNQEELQQELDDFEAKLPNTNIQKDTAKPSIRPKRPEKISSIRATQQIE